jgi:hypothetical protein
MGGGGVKYQLLYDFSYAAAPKDTTIKHEIIIVEFSMKRKGRNQPRQRPPSRAPLRLKPERTCANRGYYVRYAVPQMLAQRPGGRVCRACSAQAKAFAHW